MSFPILEAKAILLKQELQEFKEGGYQWLDMPIDWAAGFEELDENYQD